MLRQLKQLDLCSGVGAGFPLAGIQTGGFELIGLADTDSYCSDILSKRFPKVKNYKDVRSLPLYEGYYFHKPGRIDFISASPPCQPFSVEGKRKGRDDPRDCIPAVIEAIAHLQPKFFALENVPGLVTCAQRPGEPAGSYFRNLLHTIDSIGYDAEWLCVSSGHFAAPWKRERLLLVGIPRSLKLQWERATPWTEQARS